MISGSSVAGNVSSPPASILLAAEAHVAFSRNHTTARAKRLWGNSTVEVTFWIADPPDVSFYTLHCTPPMAIPDAVADADLEVIAPIRSSEPGNVCVNPRVVGAEGRFVLLSTLFRGRSRYEYFMYKRDPKSPSLESLPLPDDDYSLRGVEFAIVPRGDDDHYHLIALCCQVEMDNYRLHIYSSEAAAWTTKELPNPCPGNLITPDKVFVIRDGLLLWVDLLKGILVCDVLQKHALYIPLPALLPGNREPVKQIQGGVRRFRDITCVDGLIKLIEMEHREIEREIPEDVNPVKLVDPRTNNVLYDSDLVTLINHKPVEPKTRTEVSVDGWSAITWTRNIESNCWRMGHTVDVDDILVDDLVFSALLSSEKSESAESLTFKNLDSAWPTLSTDGNDIFFLKSTSTSGGAALVAIDLVEKKALKVEPFKLNPSGEYFYVSPWQILRPCALANHLKMTPGTETSASQIALMDSSANEPNNTAIHVGVTDSYESENKCPRLSAEKGNHAQNGAQSTVPNVLISEAPNQNNMIHVGVTDSYESENKRPRLSAEKGKHAQNGAQSTVPNVLISQAPNQNNMPPQLWVNSWEQPGCIGYSSWPLQNNPPPPQCFHKRARPFNPVYTPMPPAPIIHSYGNYQSLWQQPLLLEQKAAPMTFGPHEPGCIGTSWPQPPPQCFNKWAGPFNPVYTPMCPPPEIHSYGNYLSPRQQPRRRHLGSLMRHPINSSTTGMEPATMGIHSNTLPATHIHVVPIHQAAATTIAPLY